MAFFLSVFVKLKRSQKYRGFFMCTVATEQMA